MAINIYTVADHLNENGWKLVSNTYKNLKTPLNMICPKGHKQSISYEEWRKHQRCEECLAGDPYKVHESVPIKKNGVRRVLALDAATNTSGFSLYDDTQLIKYGIYKADANLETTERINQMKKWLIAVITEWQPDFVGLENIQLQKFGNGFQVEMYRVLANLQGVLVDTLYELGMPFQLIYSSEWREKCGIVASGRENKKKAAQDKVMTWYNLKCTQDEADAICIGKYFVTPKKETKHWGEFFD